MNSDSKFDGYSLMIMLKGEDTSTLLEDGIFSGIPPIFSFSYVTHHNFLTSRLFQQPTM
jgi:hypothetical protein